MNISTKNVDSNDKLSASEQAVKLINQAIELCKHGEYEDALPVIQRALRNAKLRYRFPRFP